MDLRAFLEALVAVALTPVVSIGMAFLVVAAIIYLAVRVSRAEAGPLQNSGPGGPRQDGGGSTPQEERKR